MSRESEVDVEVELEIDVVTLMTDEGEVDCGIITVLELNDKEYIAVSPLDEDGSWSQECYMEELETVPKNVTWRS